MQLENVNINYWENPEHINTATLPHVKHSHSIKTFNKLIKQSPLTLPYKNLLNANEPYNKKNSIAKVDDDRFYGGQYVGWWGYLSDF